MKKLFVLSLGGSLIVPENIDIKFLKQFKALVVSEIKKGSRFVIITGGGKICRYYQQALKQLSNPPGTDVDWMGIYLTRTNAELARLMFGKLAHQKIVIDPNLSVKFKEKVLLAAGWMPGRSTDDDAVRLAKKFKGQTIINLSNIDYVYTKDPRKFKDAKIIKSMTWGEYRKMVGSKWNPGANYPFDPVAAALAQKSGLKVIVANGKNLKNLRNIFRGEKFIGTTLG